MWWRASTTMRLAHTPEPDTIVPLLVRRQWRSEGLEVMEADHASTTMRLAYTPGLDTLAGGTPIRMYRQKLFFYFPSPRLFDFQNLYTHATPTAAECDNSASMWQNRLNYSGSRALMLTMHLLSAQRTSNGIIHWSVGSSPDTTTVQQDRSRLTSHKGEFTITEQLINF
jgi:hypothetical protein